MPAPRSHATLEGLEDNHGAGGKTVGEEEHAGAEDSDDGEWDGEHAPTPNSGCLSLSTLNNVVEPTGERTALVEATPSAPSPSQKKSKKAPKSPAKVLMSSWTLWTVMGLPAYGLPDFKALPHLPLIFSTETLML